ncbi:hypothetical protein CSC67_05770 [Pusillimonas caeni]|uniref:hypothetical protein n=1 Tax=Pusillimonas caeni TaxID=1348472 RepID=UPI001074C36A|nr:hypothetical protein [Pusillimonas caeni]TFL14852.1 hypothetical protein CSC67_05770 [Pusillimonas caeni]
MKKVFSKEEFARIFSQAQRYQVAMRWLWLEIYRNYKKLPIICSILMLLALGLKLGALLLLSKYVHLLDLGHQVDIFSWHIENPRRSYPLLAASATLSLLFFLGSCISTYYAEINMLRLSVLYEEHCIRRAVTIISTVGNHPKLREWRNNFSRLVSTDPRHCGTIARLVLRSFSPLASGFATLGILMYIDFELTITLALLVLLATPWLYRVSIRGSAQTRALERYATRSIQEKREWIINRAKSTNDTSIESSLGKPFEATAIGKTLNAYLGRLKATAESMLITSTVMAFAIFVILLQKGSQLLYGATGWGQLATYLIVLRICLGNLTQLMALFTSLNRFYLHLYRFMTFSVAGIALVDAGELAPATPDIWRPITAKGSADKPEEVEILDDL